jgi:hypothetical protein
VRGLRKQHVPSGGHVGGGSGVAVKAVWMSVTDVNDMMGLLPKSTVMVSPRPPLWRSRREGGGAVRYCGDLV